MFEETDQDFKPKYVDQIELKGKPIWERLFTIYIAQKHLISIEEIKVLGSRTTGDEILDNQMMNDIVTIMIPISDMAEYFRKGVGFEIVNHEDSKIIYDIITDYLEEWNRKLDNSLNMRPAPLEDLKLLDLLASKIHGHADNYRHIDDPNRTIIQDLGGIVGKWFTRNGMSQLPQQTKTEYKPEAYRSFGDVIQEKASRRIKFITPDKGGNKWSS